MDSKMLNKINSFFHEWRGASVRFINFVPSHSRFVLHLKRPDGTDSAEVSFFFCEYLSGPTHWVNSNFTCKEWQSPYDKNEIGYEVEDKDAGFLIRGTHTIYIGKEKRRRLG